MRRNKRPTKRQVIRPAHPHDKSYRVTKQTENREDVSDYCDLMWKYFSFGALNCCSYNHHFMKAVELVGALNKGASICDSRCSNYHNGVNYIAQQASVSKQEIKALSKTIHKSPKHTFIYTQKASYHVDAILDCIVKVLKEHSSSPNVREFLKMTKATNYRDAIFGPQYATLKQSRPLTDNIQNHKQETFVKLNQAIDKLGKKAISF